MLSSPTNSLIIAIFLRRLAVLIYEYISIYIFLSFLMHCTFGRAGGWQRGGGPAWGEESVVDMSVQWRDSNLCPSSVFKITWRHFRLPMLLIGDLTQM